MKNGLVFTTLQNDLDSTITGVNKLSNQFGLFGVSLRDIINSINEHGFGVIKNLFSNTITQSDYNALENYNKALRGGAEKADALAEHLIGASKAARKLAIESGTAGVNLDGLKVAADGAEKATIRAKVAAVALNAALSMGLSLAIQAVITSFNKLKNAQVNASKAAQEDAQKAMDKISVLSEEREEIDELIAKYKELKDSEHIDADTRNEIKSIQERIVSLVGDEASGIDLVNGKLDDELKKLNEIQLMRSKRNSSDYVAAYSDAKKSFNKANVRDTSDAGWAEFMNGWPGLDYDLVVKGYDKAANKILDSIDGVEVRWDSNIISTLTEFEFDASNAQEYYDILTKCIEALEDADNGYNYQDSSVYNKLVSLRKEYLSFIDTVDELSKQLLDNEVSNEIKQLYFDGMTVDSIESFVQYKDKIIENVSKNPNLASALSSGDITTTEIEDSVLDYLSNLSDLEPYYTEWINGINKQLGDAAGEIAIPEKAKISFSELIANTNKDNDFIDKIDTHIEKVNSLHGALKSFKDGSFASSDFIQLVKDFPELADNADNLDVAIIDLLGTMNTDILSEFSSQFNNLNTDKDRAALKNFQDAVIELGQVVGNTSFSIDISSETDGMANLFSAMKESVSSTGMTANSIKDLKARYQDIEGYDAAKLFERTTNGIHLNTKALRELESAYETQKKQAIDEDLNGLVAQYHDLTSQINSTSDAAKRAELYAQRSDILDQITDTADLAAQYEGLTSAFHKWEQAQSIGEEGDMYDSLAGGLEDIKQLYEDGLIGTNKFRTAVQLMSNQDLSTASADELLAAYESGYATMTRYFTDSSDGCLNFLNDVQSLNSEWAKMNEDGSWEINFGLGNDQEIANALGINVESIQAIMRKLSDYGFNVNLDSFYTSFDLLQGELEKANATLIELGKTNIVFDFETTDLDNIYSQIANAERLLNDFKNDDGTINIQADGVKETQEILAALIAKKQLLDAPSIMSVDTSNAETDIVNVIALLQEYQTNYNNLEINTAVGADTSEAQLNIQDVLTQLDTMPDELKTKLGLDTEEFNAAVENLKSTDVDVEAGVNLDQTSVDTIMFSISEITPEMMVEAGIDSSLIDGYEPPEKPTTVKIVVDDSRVVRWRAPTKRGTIIYDAKIAGGAKLNGSAHVGGTVGKAYKNGDWSINDSGVALGGELGQELIVRDGRYFTIGDKSAEFFNYKKGDIIFNAEQTKQLLSNGKISNGSKRGNAFVHGSVTGKAFSNASGSIIVNGSVQTKSNSSSKKSSKSSSNGSSDSKEKIDWIEIAINRIERAIDRLKTTATSAYKALKTKLGATYDEISKVNEEIEVQSMAYERYMREANSVGLSSNLASKVQNGAIDLTEYNSETQELIKDYQKWYEKALDCSDAIQQLHEDLAALYEDNFNNIKEDFDSQLELLAHMTATYETGIDRLEAQGYLQSTEYYAALTDVEHKNISILNSELDSLKQSFSEAMVSGQIEEGSESWYAMKIAINEVAEQIDKANLSLEEYAQTMQEIEWEHFNYRQDRISQITQEADFIIDLISNSDLHNDKGRFTNEGMATIGLHGLNYNTYMAQADIYAKEILNINKQLAEDPYNSDLIERREELLELQQDAILAADDEKQAIIALVEEGINIELEALQELIDMYTDALDSAKDLYDYQKKIRDHTSEISYLQKQLLAYENDISEETQTKIQKLQVDLKEAEENLEETEYQQYISDQKKLLDELYLEYETVLNQRLDNVDALIEEMISVVNANTDSINSTLIGVADSVGYTMTESMQAVWNGSTEALDGTLSVYGDRFNEKLTAINNVLNQIQINTSAMIGVSDSKATTTTSPTTQNEIKPSAQSNTPAKVNQISVGGKINAKGAKIYTYAGDKTGDNQFYANDPIYTVLKEQDGYLQVRYHKLSSGSTGWFKKSDVKAYKTGGLVDYTGLAQLDGTPGKPELVLNARDTANFIALKETLQRMSEQGLSFGTYYGSAYAQTLSGITDISKKIASIRDTSGINAGVNIGDTQITIEIDHVEDYNDFVARLQKDKQFERFVQSMTVDRLVGGTSLKKNKYFGNR